MSDSGNDGNFQVPSEWLGQTLQVFSKIPIPQKDGQGNVSIAFPSMIGTLKADLDGAMLMSTEDGHEILYPKANIQQVMRASDIAIAPGSTLDMLMSRVKKQP